MRARTITTDVAVRVLTGLCCLLLACGGGQDVTLHDVPAPAPDSSPAATGGEKIKIKTPDELTVVVFRPQGDEVTIEFSSEGRQRLLHGRLRDGGKRKYEEQGAVLVEVKPGDSGFKVRTPRGELLWKVKITADKIKVSDNEENRNPFVLKLGDSDRVKILENDAIDLGRVKFYRDRGKVKVKDRGETTLYEANTDRYSAAYGLLLMPDVPAAERYVVMAELLLRGR